MRYNYECENCGVILEVEQGFSDEPLSSCPCCDSDKIERVILEAPLGFVRQDPTTIGQLAERNTQQMGKYRLEAERHKHQQAKIAAKKEAQKEWQKKLPPGAKLIDSVEKPWCGELPEKNQKESSQRRFQKGSSLYYDGGGKMTDAKAPHKAVIRVQFEVHELNKNGECSGKIVEDEMLEQFKLKTPAILQVTGFDRTDCLKKLKRLLDGNG